ncbi:EKC/KEOPS complex subunit LAGE3-like isoform X2 [Crassostrea virginica]|uniref:L antigen family member 3 n=1 Tax=Crassostrea virginica TaxID=6565 RepID=A0A8B8BUQ9_CRAVI|nr:EKC/KEOPS complex subunit LAGE3-like [Crassostrea virginica]
MTEEKLKVDLCIPFPSEKEAQIAYGTLSVDAEPKRGGVKKELKVKGNVLNVHFESLEARMIRVGVNSFFDHLNLVIETMEQFGPPRK